MHKEWIHVTNIEIASLLVWKYFSDDSNPNCDSFVSKYIFEMRIIHLFRVLFWKFQFHFIFISILNTLIPKTSTDFRRFFEYSNWTCATTIFTEYDQIIHHSRPYEKCSSLLLINIIRCTLLDSHSKKVCWYLSRKLWK